MWKTSPQEPQDGETRKRKSSVKPGLFGQALEKDGWKLLQTTAQGFQNGKQIIRMSFKLNIKVFSKPKRQLEQKVWDILGEARKIRCELFVLCWERSLPWVLCQETLECWQSQKAAWQHPPCINPSAPLLHDPRSTSLQSSPCPALPVPPWHSHTSSGQAGPGSRNGTCSQIQGFGISQCSKGLGAGRSLCVCSCSQHPWDSLCLYVWVSIWGYCVYFRVYHEHIWL